MATPASVNQRAQWGTETSSAVAVPADRTFRATSLTFGPKFDVGNVRPSGMRFRTINYVKKEWSEGSIEGIPCFNELPDFLTWSLGPATTVDNGDGTQTSTWEASTGTTRTIQIGDDTSAAQVVGCFVKGFSLGWGRNSGDATLNADVVGGRWDDSRALTPDPSILPVLPVVASEVSVYVATTRAGLDSGLLPDAIKVDFSTGDMRDAVWTLDASYTSLSDIVPLAMDDASVEMLVKANATGKAFLAALRNSDTWYVRVEANGPQPRRFRMEFAVQATDHTREDTDGVWAATVPFAVVQDADGFSHSFEMIDVVP